MMTELDVSWRTDYSPDRQAKDPARFVRCILIDRTTGTEYDVVGYGSSEEAAVRDGLSKAITAEKPLTPAQRRDVEREGSARNRLAAVMAERDQLRAQLEGAGIKPADPRGESLRAMFAPFKGNKKAGEFLDRALADPAVTLDAAAEFVRDNLAKKDRVVWTGNKSGAEPNGGDSQK